MDPNPQEGIRPSPPPAPTSPPPDAIASGHAPAPQPPAKKSYEQYDDGAAVPLPSLSRSGGDGSGLQSLAQSARSKHLNQARWAMYIIGGLTIAANVFMLVTNRANVENILRRQGINQVPPDIEQLLFQDLCIGVLFVALGLVFIGLGIAVKSRPVVCTVTGLVLYIVGFLITVALNPASIIQGIVVKVIVFAALFKAVSAARAYEAEQAEMAPAD